MDYNFIHDQIKETKMIFINCHQVSDQIYNILLWLLTKDRVLADFVLCDNQNMCTDQRHRCCGLDKRCMCVFVYEDIKTVCEPIQLTFTISHKNNKNMISALEQKQNRIHILALTTIYVTV